MKIGNQVDSQSIASDTTQTEDVLGVTVQTLTSELAQQFNTSSDQGVVITKVDANSVAAMAGLRVGMVIEQVNRKAVKSADDFLREVNESRKDKRVLLLISERGMSRYAVLSWR